MIAHKVSEQLSVFARSAAIRKPDFTAWIRQWNNHRGDLWDTNEYYM
jgi:hypothetical protein